MLEASSGDDDYLWGKEPNSYLVSVASMLVRGTALCLADRGGRNAVYLASLGFQPLVVDDSESGLEQAQRLAEEHGVSVDTRLVDWETYEPEPGEFDNVISVFCHLPPTWRRRLHASVVDALRPGGMFVLEAFRSEQVKFWSGGTRDVSCLLSRADVLAEIAGLDCLRVGQVTRRLNEGRFLQGRAAMLEILARKRHQHRPRGMLH